AIENHRVAVEPADGEVVSLYLHRLVVRARPDEDQRCGRGGIDGRLDRVVVARYLQRGHTARVSCRGHVRSALLGGDSGREGLRRVGSGGRRSALLVAATGDEESGCRGDALDESTIHEQSSFLEGDQGGGATERATQC